MRRVLILLSTATAVWFTSPPAQALGFGKAGSATLLGQPLDFFATVHLDSDEVLERNCVSAEVQAGENRLGAEQFKVSLAAGSAPGERTVRVTTLRMIDEPIVTVSVTVGCGPRVSRKFVAFLDPPVLNLAHATEAQATAFAPQLDTPRAARIAMAGPGRAATRAPAARARSSRRVRNRVAAHAGRAPRSAPRLQLEAAAPIAARAAESAASAAAALAASLAIVPAAAADPETLTLRIALAEERQRIRQLESGLARLRADAESTQQSVGALQARLRQAETERYTNPLVYLLGGLCALLTAVAAVALRLRAHAGAARWWDRTQQPPAAPVAPPAAVASVPVATAGDEPWTYHPPRLARVAAATGFDAAPSSSIGGLEVTQVLDHALLARIADEPAANGPLDRATVAVRAFSIEDLIDLEQQAEFLVVLGKDDAAIDLLSARLGGSGAASPLPYYRLLEIHHRRGAEAAYARIAEAFFQRFGAVAPGWDVGPGDSRALESYPQAVARLQRAWSNPAEAMELLDSWLFRRQPADDTFDFAACRELLALYSIARELAEPARAEVVDLLLPLVDPDVDMQMPIVTTPSHFAELYTLPSRPAPLDLDISRPAPFAGESERRKAI